MHSLCQGAPLSVHMCIYIYIYIYIYRVDCIYVHIYTYVLTHTLTCTYTQAREKQAADEQERLFLVADAKPSKRMDQEQKVCLCAVDPVTLFMLASVCCMCVR